MEIAPMAAAGPYRKGFCGLSLTDASGRHRTDARVPDDLPPVLADPHKMTWVLSNLLSNALRYTPEGGHIRMRRGAGRRVALSAACSDDGAGIPLEYQSQDFREIRPGQGRQAGGQRPRPGDLREIVRAHGGSIWVESSPGKGSTFTFTLKAATPPVTKPIREA